MRTSTLICMGILVLTGFVGAQEAQPTKEVTGADELVKKKGLYQETWVRPDADMARYSKLYLWQPEFQFREGAATSAGTTTQMMRGDGGPYAVRPEDQERFKQLVTETFVAEIERSKLFEVVDRPGPETLIVRAGFLDIVSDVPPNPTRVGNIHLASVGEATLVFELVDAETGVIQARAAERREIQPDSRMRGVNVAPANSATVWMDVERWARDRAQDLRKALEKAKKKAET